MEILKTMFVIHLKDSADSIGYLKNMEEIATELRLTSMLQDEGKLKLHCVVS